MESSSVAEQRATAVAKLKRAASLPRMKDGRRPPMHVEAVSEGERVQGDGKLDEDSAQESEEGKPEPEPEEKPPVAPVEDESKPEPEGEDKAEEVPPPERSTTPNKKRRSRSRTRSRGSKDLRQKPKPTIITNTTESSADEYCAPTTADDAPPSPPLVSPTPSRFPGTPTSRLLRSPLGPYSPIFYPGTAPSTPMIPTLDDIRYGLYRSNSAGAARAMAMQKLTGGTEPIDMGFTSSSPTPPPLAGLTRNNTVSGGERLAARNVMLNRLNGRIKGADGDQTSGGEEAPTPVTPTPSKRRRRRSRRASSRASGVLDDRDDREPLSTSPNTPIHPPSPSPLLFGQNNDRPWTPGTQQLPHSKQQIDVEAPMGGRGIVVEDEDEDLDRLAPQKLYPNLPSTPARLHGPRLPHTSDAPNSISAESAPATGVPVPVFLSSSGSYKPDPFPASPFATPLKERLNDVEIEDDEESEIYRELRSRSASRIAFERDSEISWVADPVPRMPIHDDDEESDEEGEAEVDPGPPTPEPGPPVEQVAEDRESESYDEPSSASHTSNTVKEDADESLTSPEPVTPQLRPSSPSGLMISAPPTSDRAPPAQPPSPVYPMRLSVATPNQFDRSPSTMEFPWEENRIAPTESAPKQGETTWERIKGAFFTRSTSSNGRRSRTNSIGARERRYNTESSVSRESGASLTNGKVEKRDSSGPFAHQQNQPPLMQTPSASASILSLTPAISPGGASPIPLASAADLTRYADSKLAPFPGMKQLEEQRRAKALLSASSPDIVLATNSIEATQSTGSSSSATTRSPDTQRERKLSHQMSDSRIFAKFSPPVLSTTPSGASHTDYFSVPQTANSTPPASASSSLKLPMNREGVKRWLTAKKLFSSQSSSSQSPPIALVSPVIADPRPRQPTKKSSFSDLLKSRKESEPVWDDLEEDKSRTPTSAPSPGQVGKFIFKEDMKQTEVRVDIEHIVHDENHPPSTPPKQTNGCPPNNPPTLDFISFSPVFSSFPSPPDPPSSVTPDPQSSLDEFPTRSTSDSYSSTSSSRHSPHTHTPNPVPSKLGLVMERLDEILGRGSKSSLWVQPIDDPPRKLLLSSPVLQVANANTVKDRFLFLFTDIMIIAKPIMYENDALLESAKPNPSDRKFIVKSVVMLRDLRVSGERDESRVKLSSHTSSARHPCITSFVRQFAKDPDRAVTELFAKANSKNDPVALGQLIQRSIDLDRVRVGEYLTRRSSKSTLKAYVDAFEFVGLRIDKALRAFLLSVWVPPTPGALEHLLDSFAGRWYEANAGIVAFDKDQAIRLVRAILQLNEVLHGGVSQTPGMTPYPRRNVLSKDFIEAFKRPDPRCLVPEDLLDKVYIAIRREHLSHARNTSTSNSTPDIVITVKRPIPPRLTYRLQSEPVVFRIPHPDPLLTIQLFGQDLVFEPSVLNFAKSAEASFRVTGTSLGPKTIIMWRSGPSALLYSGLPLSSPVVVERSFMRYTFQLAFPNQHGAKRKYMFSVDDSVIRHQWVENIKHQIDIVSAGHVGPKMINNTPESSKAYEAAEVVAFKVLQDTLIQPHDDHDISQDAVNHALARLTNGANGVANGHLGIPENTPRRRRVSSHGRSKSRSQVYQRTGAGKMEPEPDCDDGEESSPVPEDSSGPHSRSDVKMWSVRELSVICRQNSSIAPVLAYFGAAGTDSNAVTS